MKVGSAKPLRLAQQEADRAVTAIFRSIVEQTAGVILAASDADGTLPVSKADAISARIREIVENQFVVRRRAVTDRDAELARLSALLARARAQAEAASGASRRRALARVRLLMKRYTLLERDGIAFEAFDGGKPLTPYASAVWQQLENVTRAQVEAHTKQMRRALAGSPGAVERLSKGWRP